MTGDELHQRLGQIAAHRGLLDFLRSERESLESALKSGAISDDYANGFACALVVVVEQLVCCLLRIEAEVRQVQSDGSGPIPSLPVE